MQNNSPSGFSTGGRPQYGPGWAARLFGGTDPLAGGLLSNQDARGLGRNALFQTGLALLQNSGPAPFRRGLGEILGTSLQSGVGAYEHGVQGTLAQRQLRQQQAEQARIQQSRQELAQMISSDPERAREAIPLLLQQAAGGDENATKILGVLSNLQQNPARANLDYIQSEDARGNPIVLAVDPADPRNPRAEYQGRRPTVPASGHGTESSWGAMGERFARNLYDPYTVKTINAYHQFNSHLAEARHGNPAAYKSAVSAFITNAEPNNQLRLGMLQYLQDVDPSLKGRTDIALQRLTDGTWPDRVLEGMQKVVEDNYRQIRERTQRRYDAYRQTNPDAAEYVESPAVRFGDAAPVPGSALNRIGGGR